MDKQGVRDAIVKFLAEEFGLDGRAIGSGTRLFSSDLLSSLDMVRLLEYLEEGLGVRVDPAEVSLAALDSVGDIVELVMRRRG